jgi:hypothetical protein
LGSPRTFSLGSPAKWREQRQRRLRLVERLGGHRGDRRADELRLARQQRRPVADLLVGPNDGAHAGGRARRLEIEALDPAVGDR